MNRRDALRLAAIGLAGLSLPARGARLDGLPVPAVQVQTASGQILPLSDLKGTALLINFWATWCAPCVTELPVLDRLHRRFQQGDGVRILAVCVDDTIPAPEVEGIMRGKGFALPLAFEATGQAAAAFGLVTIPMTFLVSPAGLVVETIVGARRWDSDAWESRLKKLGATP